MTLSLDDFQRLLGIAALCIGAVYILGGLIVNLHLSRFGVTEYRLLKAKYLAVGLNFLFNTGIAVGLIAIFNLLNPINRPQDLQIRLILSLFAMLFGAAVYYNRRFYTRVKLFLAKFFRRKEQAAAFYVWWLMIFGIGLYPMSLAFPKDLISANIASAAYFNIDLLLAIMISMAGLALATLFFGIELYANPVPTGPDAADLIGTGKLQRVQFVGNSEDIELIKQLGIPLETPNRTIELGLLDETDDYYLVVLHLENEEKAFKIRRELVKAIAYQRKQTD